MLDKQEKKEKTKKTLLVIDANSVMHRAFHALPPLTTKKGELVNAVYGFLLVFLRAIKEFKPDFITICFDSAAPTFRHDKFIQYKTKRKKAPQEFYDQIPKIKEILKSFNVAIFEKEGFEADDIIGTICHIAPKKQVFPKLEIIVLSGDSDILQLVNETTRVYFLKKGVKDIVLYDIDKVKEKYEGLSPEQILEFKALRGDPSDSIPGVLGIGEKTAIELLKDFKTLEGVYDNIALIKDSVRKKLIDHKDEAFLSRQLAEINKNVPIDFNLKDCEWLNGYRKENARAILEKFEFNSLINRLP